MLFGPVDNPFNPNGWIRTRCGDSDNEESLRTLPDLKDKEEPNSCDPMWSSSQHDDVSKDDIEPDEFEDAEETVEYNDSICSCESNTGTLKWICHYLQLSETIATASNKNNAKSLKAQTVF